MIGFIHYGTARAKDRIPSVVIYMYVYVGMPIYIHTYMHTDMHTYMCV